MIRLILGFALSAVALCLAARTACVQVDNFEAAAELDRLMEEAEWNARRCSGINPEIRKFEFDLTAEQTRLFGTGTARPGY